MWGTRSNKGKLTYRASFQSFASVMSSMHGQRSNFVMPCRRAQKRYREKKLQEVDQYKLQVILDSVMSLS